MLEFRNRKRFFLKSVLHGKDLIQLFKKDFKHLLSIEFEIHVVYSSLLIFSYIVIVIELAFLLILSHTF